MAVFSKRALNLIIFIAAIISTIVIFTQYKPAELLFTKTLMYIDQNKLIGSLIYMIIFGIVSCLMVPVTIFMLTAGVLFKPWPLSILVSILGIQTGVIFGMMAGKTFLKPWVSTMVKNNKKYRAIDNAVVQFGWKVVVLMRLTPIIPLGMANYLFSATTIKIKTVMLSTLVGCFPGYMVVPTLGSMMGSLQETQTYQIPLRLKLCSGLLILCFAIGSSIFFAIIGQQALRNMANIDLTINSDDCTVIDDDSKVNLDDCKNNKIVLNDRDSLIIKLTFSIIFVIISLGIPMILYI